jgi:Na+/H+-dicarboxylate symporter
MFQKMPIILLAIIALLFAFDGVIPYECKSQVFAFSLLVKSIIIFSLPFIIFMLLFKTVARLSSGATKIIFLILAGVICSNFISTMVSYQIGAAVYQLDLSLALPQDSNGLMPAWSLAVPKLVSNDVAMFSGLILGVLVSLVRPGVASQVAAFFDKVVAVAFRLLTVIVPIFIAGFVVKLNHDKVIHTIARDYAGIFVIVALSVMAYVAFIYLVSNNFKIANFLKSIKNMFPAAVAGFSSMSSAAAMPLTLIGAEKNSQNSNLARLAIPTTVNVHLIGDCFAIPIFAFAVMKNYGMAEPLFYSYLIFAVYFVIAKFSVAAIPGGGIIVMLPILESQLGFTAEMGSMITALYILFDPVITCANVMGNGGFALAIDRLSKVFQKSPQVE